MELQETADKMLMIGEGFRQAKVEHYLAQAEEYVQMSRYQAARKAVEQVLGLDPENRTADSLRKRIDYQIESLLRRHSGASKFDPGMDHKSPRLRRDELVMVVDQDERVLISLTQSLRKYGFEAVAAAGYQEALETFMVTPPDMVVSEVNFENGPAGFDLFLWVRTNARHHELPFLFLATKIDRDTLIAGKRLGVNDFIPKPLDEDVVTASIINCLARRKKEQTSV